MNGVKRSLMWFFMLNKRLYKKPSFIIVIALIACVALFMGAVSKSDADILRIAVYAKEDLPVQMKNEMQNEDSLIGFEFFDSEEQAINEALSQNMDSVWVFERDIESACRLYIEKKKPIVRVIQPEDTIFLRLAREKLFTLMYPYISRVFYHDFMEKNFGETDTQLLDSYYDTYTEQRSIIDISYSNSYEKVSETSYIASPMRGLLAIAVFLCAYSALCGFKQDVKRGMFARVKSESMAFMCFLCVFTACANASAISLICIGLCGLCVGWGAELIFMLLYVIMCSVFCVLIGQLCDRVNLLSAFMPIIIIAILIACPVFFSSRNIVQCFFPTYYYLAFFRSGFFMVRGIIYTAGLLALLSLFSVFSRFRFRV